MKKEDAIKWLEVIKEDAFFEQYDALYDALKMAIEALENAEINCVHCPRYYETEDDIGVHSHCGGHGRLIDANALMEYCLNQKTKTINNNDIARFPTVQAHRPHGEWIETTSGTVCNNCGEYPYDDGEYHIANWHSNFCPSCGADMRQKK